MPRLPTLALAALLLAPPAAAAQDSATHHVARVNGIEMHYQLRGAGEPLLLLHGFGACGDDWEPHVARLAATYRVIIPDLRGHGGSTNPAGTFTFRESARDVAALLDTLGLARVRAMGISAGGMTLLHLATTQPARLEAMVLIGATTYFPEQARTIMRLTGDDAIPPEIREMYARCATRGDAQIRELMGQFAGFAHSYDEMTFTPPHLATITARTLIVHGDRDDFFPVDIPVAMYQAIPGSALWIVPEGDHVPIYGPREGHFQEVALRFLAGAARR